MRIGGTRVRMGWWRGRCKDLDMIALGTRDGASPTADDREKIVPFDRGTAAWQSLIGQISA
jgi:hypothetical protein